jgi:hypothetical protein
MTHIQALLKPLKGRFDLGHVTSPYVQDAGTLDRLGGWNDVIYLPIHIEPCLYLI